MAVSAETAAKLSDLAKTRPRDARGHFIKAGTDPATTVAREVSTNSPLPTLSTPPPLPTLPPLKPDMTQQNSAATKEVKSKNHNSTTDLFVYLVV